MIALDSPEVPLNFGSMDEGRRPPYAAFLVAAPSAVVLWMGLLLLYTTALEGPTRAAELAPYVLMGGVLFGFPLVVGVLLVAGLPAFFLLRSTLGLTRPRVLLAGAVLGVLVRWAVEWLWSEPEAGLLPLPVVLAVGVGTAAAWWRAWVGPGEDAARRRRGTI